MLRKTVAINVTLKGMYNDPTHVLKGCEENDKILLMVNMTLTSYKVFVSIQHLSIQVYLLKLIT